MDVRRFLALFAALAVAGALAVPAFAHPPDRGERGRGHREDSHDRGEGRGEGRGGGRRGDRPAQTKMRFRLDDQQWESGATVTGTISLRTGRGRGEPLIDALVRVLVDDTEVGTAVTDTDGKATVSWGPATDGSHRLRVIYDGDDIHKRAKRTRGFCVGQCDSEGEDEEEDVEPSPTPTPEPETTPTL